MPITPEEAEAHAKKAITQYIADCKLTDSEQIGDVLMKLLSVTGVVLAQAVGGEDAAARIYGVAVFIQETMPAGPAKLVPIQ